MFESTGGFSYCLRACHDELFCSVLSRPYVSRSQAGVALAPTPVEQVYRIHTSNFSTQPWLASRTYEQGLLP